MGLAVLAALLLAAPAAGHGDVTIEAQTVWRFDAMSYELAEGGLAAFHNEDAVSPGPHDVTATDTGPDGRPLFSTPQIRAGQEAPVDGAAALPAGSYDFYCTVHPFMGATLVVTPRPGAPAPAPPPPSSDDTRAPALTAELRGGSLRSRAFAVAVRADEAASVRLRLVARIRRRNVLVGTAEGSVARAGAEAVFTIRARGAARRALRRARRARLIAGVEGRDAAGNVGAATARRTLRR